MRKRIALGLAALAVLGCTTPPPNRWESRGDRILGIGSTRAEDPVSGVQVEKKDAIQRQYQDTTYYFESPETAEIFLSHPEEYAISVSEGRTLR